MAPRGWRPQRVVGPGVHRNGDELVVRVRVHLGHGADIRVSLLHFHQVQLGILLEPAFGFLVRRSLLGLSRLGDPRALVVAVAVYPADGVVFC